MVSSEAFQGADDWRLYDLDRPNMTMATGRNRPILLKKSDFQMA
jgi:hypothetical protein